MLLHIYSSNYFNYFKICFAYIITDLVSQDNEIKLLENLDFQFFGKTLADRSVTDPPCAVVEKF